MYNSFFDLTALLNDLPNQSTSLKSAFIFVTSRLYSYASKKIITPHGDNYIVSPLVKQPYRIRRINIVFTVCDTSGITVDSTSFQN